MPVGKKKSHDFFSPKIAEKRNRRREAAQEAVLAKKKALAEGRPDPNIPAKVNNFKSAPLFGPHKIKKKQTKVVQRKVSPMEGKSIVNTKVADKNLIHKPRPKKKSMDPTAGAIEMKKVKKPVQDNSSEKGPLLSKKKARRRRKGAK